MQDIGITVHEPNPELSITTPVNEYNALMHPITPAIVRE